MTEFIEYMVERKKTALDIIMAFLIFALGIIIVFFLMGLPINGTLSALLIIGVVYVLYKFVAKINTEYEYIITNNEMDIDRIINKRTRKRIDTVNLRRVSEFGFCVNGKENRYLNDGSIQKIIACRDRSEKCAYLVYTQDEMKKVLLFTPNDEMKEYIEKIVSGNFR